MWHLWVGAAADLIDWCEPAITQKHVLQIEQETLVIQQGLQVHVASVAPVVLADCGVIDGLLRSRAPIVLV